MYFGWKIAIFALTTFAQNTRFLMKLKFAFSYFAWFKMSIWPVGFLQF